MLVVFSIVPLFKVVGKSFTPVDDRSEYLVSIRTPEGTSLAATTNVMERIARDIRGLPHVLATLTTVGGGSDRAANSGTIYVKLTPKDQRKESQQEMMIKTRDVFKNYPPDLRTSVGVQSWSGTGDVQYAISGPDLDKLSQYSQQLLARLKTLPNVVDADTSLVYGKPELRVEIDRQRAADLGVRVSDIATALNTMIAGQVVSSFPSGGEQYDVRLRAAQEFRTSTNALTLLAVSSSKAGPVSLDQVVRIKPGTAPSSIDRLDRQRQVTISANLLPGGSQAEVLAKLDKFAAGFAYGSRVHGRPAWARAKNWRARRYYFIVAVSLTLIFMYMVLAAQFESFLHPFTILLTLPLAVPFGILSLLIAGQTINIFSGLGLLLLFGIVKKNAILQIAHTNSFACFWHGSLSRDHAGQSRPAPADSDDHYGAGSGNAARGDLEQSGIGQQPVDRRAGGGRTIDVPAADAAGGAGVLFACLRMPSSRVWRAPSAARWEVLAEVLQHAGAGARAVIQRKGGEA